MLFASRRSRSTTCASSARPQLNTMRACERPLAGSHTFSASCRYTISRPSARFCLLSRKYLRTTVAAFGTKNQQSVYLGFWRVMDPKPAPLLGVGPKCVLELSNSGRRDGMSALTVVASGVRVGTLEVEDGLWKFSYVADWSAFALSPNFPIEIRVSASISAAGRRAARRSAPPRRSPAVRQASRPRVRRPTAR